MELSSLLRRLTVPTIVASSVTSMASSMSAAASSCSDGGPGPKRRRLLDAGGPIEDDETARQKMRDATVYARGVDGTWLEYAGFDPDNVADVKSVDKHNQDAFRESSITPMGYFAQRGDLPMMRWLYVNGADTRDVEVMNYFPMLMAALTLRVEVCKWLFDRGAAKDVKRRACGNYPGHLGFPHGRSPLTLSLGDGREDLNRWLILNGALCKDDESGELDVEIMRQDLGSKHRVDHVQKRKALLEWATDLHRPRTSFLLFLSGACITRRSSSPARLLSGKSDALELIFDYTGGIILGREAKIIRQLKELLPKKYFRNK